MSIPAPRAEEVERVQECFASRFSAPARIVDARDRFLSALAGVDEPERKRRLIGRI